MRSKAHLKSHPIHPILVSFPIAFFTGTLISHVAGWLMEKESLLHTAVYLNGAGIGFAVLAAIPGLIDLMYTVPPDSSARKRGVKHGLINTLVLLLFIVAFILRRKEGYSHTIILALELTGVVLMMIAGWLGGTLVYRNQIGVDQRYGNAGKWNEAYINGESGRLEVATVDELKENAMKLLHIDGKRIVLARTENGHVAFEDRCPHKGGSLAGGSIACGTVQCPWHGSQFDVHTGNVKAGPAKTGIATYKVEIEEGKILLLI